ncbi:hypothetical protein [Sphingobacterium cellulitidis]|uniref:hypothetical protein n=1 Tax=Sphingobacterium cellulitidis TaxID=1768011 RepID=UPI003C7D85EC
MKKFQLTLLFCSIYSFLMACPVCERNQPKIFRGWVHGTMPKSDLEYVLVLAIFLISVIALILFIKMLIKPGENQADHIKRGILNPENYEPKK